MHISQHAASAFRSSPCQHDEPRFGRAILFQFQEIGTTQPTNPASEDGKALKPQLGSLVDGFRDLYEALAEEDKPVIVKTNARDAILFLDEEDKDTFRARRNEIFAQPYSAARDSQFLAMKKEYEDRALQEKSFGEILWQKASADTYNFLGYLFQ